MLSPLLVPSYLLDDPSLAYVLQHKALKFRILAGLGKRPDAGRLGHDVDDQALAIALDEEDRKLHWLFSYYDY